MDDDYGMDIILMGWTLQWSLTFFWTCTASSFT